MSDSQSFSRSYAQARAAFVGHCERAGWAHRSFVNPHANAPDGSPLTMDFGWAGPRDASRVLLSVSGTHGLEAFAGAAAQLTFARSLTARQLPPDTAVMFVHGYNAFGWAHGSRVNENNVDLNRNMVDFDATLPANPLYDTAVHGLFAPATLSADPVEQMREEMQRLFDRHGHDPVYDAINRGQYTRADGVYYGGRSRVWSSEILLSLVRDSLARVSRVTCIDWHTGMGEYGDTFFICWHTRSEARFRNACRWWGEHKLLDESGYSDAPRPSYQGVVMNALDRACARQGCELTGVVIEFGTFDPDRVEAAIMIDRALRHGGHGLDANRAASLRALMHDSFNPDDARWRDRVCEQSLSIYNAALAGMAES
jgi:hypothetical protein